MKISQKKREKIYEQILALLYSQSPKSLFTNYVAQELARDEEFIKKTLLELKEKGLVKEIIKNPKGKKYKLRRRWTLSEQTYQAYKNQQ